MHEHIGTAHGVGYSRVDMAVGIGDQSNTHHRSLNAGMCRSIRLIAVVIRAR
jgi:hypothetical protein